MDSLLEAPAYGADGQTVADTLVPGAAEAGMYDGKKYASRTPSALGGIWYRNR